MIDVTDERIHMQAFVGEDVASASSALSASMHGDSPAS